MLGVVDHQHERLDQQPRDLFDQLARRRESFEALRAAGETLAQRVRCPGSGLGDRVHDRHHEHARLAVLVGAADPRDPAVEGGERLLEDRRLAESGAGGEQQRAPLDRLAHAPGEAWSRDRSPAP